ncbi:PilZ domain-containing protein [Methylophaga frappieri]|uniref:PilZ domain-containing protein n=1 Tax=Methylophaga frappieri (strain ATCC BAA-2434 / DSM 25690 / JAM7) TaxID=754477 RepID=I1YHR8_METFJ|nr:MbeD/MobD family mobilization/exclusion protein [Methylophaga frappieri]AFJ02461.1 PilZ domain-containing protein [Methylophaga frappieri]
MDDVSAATGIDRRAYFRINDRILITLLPLASSAVAPLAQQIMHATPQPTDPSQQFSSLQSAFTHLTDQIGHTDRDVARALRMLDEKLNILSSQVQHLLRPVNEQDTEAVNLSAGGIALMSPQRFDKHTALEVKLTLLPGNQPVHAIANVIACEPVAEQAPDKSCFLRLAFTHMNETDRNRLVKHTLSRQAEDLRQQKQSTSENSL